MHHGFMGTKLLIIISNFSKLYEIIKTRYLTVANAQGSDLSLRTVAPSNDLC